MSDEYEYKAFLSYSRTDRVLATALQAALETFAKNSNVPRRYRVFRDEATLAAGGSLPERLRGAITASEFLIVIATPDAAHSPWVQQEISVFLERHPSERLLVVLARGHLRWNAEARDFHRDADTAFPSIQAFTDEPLYVDLTQWKNDDLEDAVATLTASLTGQSKDDLIGTSLRQYEQSRRRLRFNLAFRGAVGGAFGAAIAFLAALLLGNSGWGVLAGAATGGALAALASGLRWRGMLAFAPSFALAALGFLFAGIAPFRSGIIDYIGLFFVQLVLCAAAGFLGARWIRGLRGRQMTIGFSIASAIVGILLIVFASKRPFEVDLPILAPPWFFDRVVFAWRAVFTKPKDFDTSFVAMFAALTTLLGTFLGLEHANVELPARARFRESSARRWRPVTARIAAAAGAVAIVVVVIGWTPIQKRIAARELIEGFYSTFANGFRDAEQFQSALTARNALRKAGFKDEANELTALIQKSVQELSFGYYAREELPAIARSFEDLGDAGELQNLMATGEAAIPKDPSALIFLTDAALSLRKPYARTSQLINRLTAQRNLFESSTELGEAALVLDRAGRSAEAKQMLETAFEKIAPYYRDHPIVQSHPSWFESKVGDLLWRYGLWDSMPQWKSDLQVDEVVRAMARSGQWNRALELSALDRYVSSEEATLKDLVEMAATKGDFMTAFRVYATLDQRHHEEWTYKASALHRLAVAAQAHGVKGKAAIVIARAKANEIASSMGNYTYSDDVLAELAGVAIAAGEEPERVAFLSQLQYDTEGANVVIEAAAFAAAHGDRNTAEARLRRAWIATHRDEGVVDPQCHALGQISMQLVSMGRLTSARIIADECDPTRFESYYIQRLNALSRILSATS